MHRSGRLAACLTLLGVLGTVMVESAAADLVGAPGADDAAPFFEPTEVSSLEFTLTPEARADLDEDPNEYVPAQLDISSTAGTYSDVVGLRLKGSTSFRTLDGKAAFKVKFKEFGGDKFLDLKKLTLNNMVQDPSMVHESLSYELFRAAGVPAPRVGYSFVHVDGAPFGVYANVETLDDVSLPLWFGSTEHLYEGSFDVDVRADDVERYEVDEGDEDDRSDLEALVTAVDGGTGSFTERLAGHADVDEMAAEFAVEKYVGAWDNYTANDDGQKPNNYYLHSDAGVFTVLPWGHDQSLSRKVLFDGVGGVLFEGCRGDATCWQRFRDVLAGLPGQVAALDLDQRAVEIGALLAPLQDDSPREEFTPLEMALALEHTRNFLRDRVAQLYDPLEWAYGPPLIPTRDAQERDPAAVDVEAPETVITKGPQNSRLDEAKRTDARLRFESSDRGAAFECRLGDRPFERCDSPVDVRVGRGKHVFRVRAIDAAGNADATPATHRWRIRRDR